MLCHLCLILVKRKIIYVPYNIILFYLSDTKSPIYFIIICEDWFQGCAHDFGLVGESKLFYSPLHPYCKYLIIMTHPFPSNDFQRCKGGVMAKQSAENLLYPKSLWNFASWGWWLYCINPSPPSTNLWLVFISRTCIRKVHIFRRYDYKST